MYTTKTNTCQTLVNRCRILLALDENHLPVRTYDECMALFCISRPTVSNVAKTYVKDGLEAVLKIKRNANSNNARRKVDGRMEARFDEPVSREAIRRTLKKTGLDLIVANTGVSQTRRMQNL